MDLELGDKVAVVTGGTRGIGLAVARALAAEGAAVVLVSRHEAEAEDQARLLAGASGVRTLGVGADTRTLGVGADTRTLGVGADTRTLGVGADTTNDEAVARLAERVAEVFGGAQILVNCAAAPAGQAAVPPPSETAWETLATHMNTKVMGYLRCARALLPGMRQAGWGRIINVSGLGARRTGDVVGTIRNVAVTALSKNLADELAGTGISVNTVHPGLTRTGKVDAMIAARAEREGRSIAEMEGQMASGVLLGRLPTADEVAQVIAFLASPRAVSINGDAIAVGGGARGPIFY